MLEMKGLLAITIFLALSIAAIGQVTPLTQAEYVKLLYSLQKDPQVRQEIVDALRKRGISFAY